MSFTEFRTTKALNNPAPDQSRIEHILSLSAKLESIPYIDKQNQMTLLSHEILDILGGGEDVSGELMDALYAVSDDIIADMGDERGVLHTYLRHIKHIQSGDGYSLPMAENLTERFKRFGVSDVIHGQFFDAQRDGSLHLNPWGELMLERLDECQILEAYYAPQNPGFKQIYAFGHNLFV